MADRMILGEGVSYSTDSKETGLNNNVLVCGGSGSGKTMSIAEPRILDAQETSQVITVTKRRLVKKYKPLLKKRGYNVLELNFVHPLESDLAFDPLAYVRTASDVTFLAKSLVEADPQKKNSNMDPYWDSAAVSLLSAEIAYTTMTMENPTFADVLALHDSLEFSSKPGDGIVTSLDRKFEELDRAHPNCFAVVCWRSFRQLPVKTAGCVYGVLNAVIDTVFTKDLRSMMQEKPNIDIPAIGQEKTVVFISTSAVNPALHSFVNMFYAQLFKQLFEVAEELPDGILPVPVHVLCDDFATGGRVLNFPEYISIFREKRISVTLLLQSESQLRSMYGEEDTVTIINNCDTYLYMGGMDISTCRAVSERLNQPLEDVLYMPIGQVFIFRRGQRPIITKRYNILDNELYVRLTAAFEEAQKKEQEWLEQNRERLELLEQQRLEQERLEEERLRQQREEQRLEQERLKKEQEEQKRQETIARIKAIISQ